MKKLAPLTFALLTPLALIAQNNAQDATQNIATSADTDRDRSMIVSFLEDNLSGAGRDIRIDGFEGLLSSTAKMQQLTIADDQGIWFTLRDAELDWSRKALLAGRVEVTKITAGEILFDRLPDAGSATADLPDPEASPFALPDLPVSINIGEITAEHVRLGAPVLNLGAAVELSLSGSAQLADGSGRTRLDIARIDGIAGQFALAAGFDNSSEQLDLDLALSEGAGGLVATLANLPGAPSLSLTAKGSGPLDGFSSDIALSTDGAERLTGRVALQAEPDPAQPDTPVPRRFSADLSGDLTPLFSPDYARFFGESSILSARGMTRPAGGFALETLTLSTRTLLLTGALDLAGDGLPNAFDLSGTLVSPDGAPVLLPFGSAQSTVRSAALHASYDVRKGEDWLARMSLDAYAQDGLAFGTATFEADGTISRRRSSDGATTLGAVKSRFALVLDALQSDDPALQQAIGPAPRLSGRLSWRENLPVAIETLRADLDDTTATLSGALSGLSSGLEFAGTLALDTPDLSRFAALSGQKISGALTARAKGSIAPLNGSFDLDGEARGENLRFGIAQLDALTGRDSTVALSARRDETGVTLRAATLETTALSAEAQGILSTETGALNLSGRLDNVARLGLALSGPLSLDAQMSFDGADSPWQTQAQMTGPGGSKARLSGHLAQTLDHANLALSGTAPLGLSNRLTTAALTQGNAAFDLNLNGPLALSSLSGQVQTIPGARVVIPSAGLALSVDRGVARLNGEAAQLDIAARADTGGSLTTTGTIGLSGDLPADLNIGVAALGLVDPQFYSTTLTGALQFGGGMAGGGTLSGQLTLGKTDVTVSPTALGASGDIPEISHIGASRAVQITRARAGLITAGGTGGAAARYGLALTIDAPNQIFMRGRGLDAELGGRLTLRGTTTDVIPVGQFSLIRGRLSLLGKRIVMEEGAITLQGDLDPTMRLVAVTESDDLTVRLITQGAISAPELTLSSSPDLPQDEILARLLFGKSLSEISALQAAQMAAAVATLTGGGGGLVSSIRDSFDLDDLDLQSSEDGTRSLKLGKYISDTVYTDVTIDNEGKTQIDLNLDAGKNVTVKGMAATDGSTGIGVFFEKDY